MRWVNSLWESIRAKYLLISMQCSARSVSFLLSYLQLPQANTSFLLWTRWTAILTPQSTMVQETSVRKSLFWGNSFFCMKSRRPPPLAHGRLSPRLIDRFHVSFSVFCITSTQTNWQLKKTDMHLCCIQEFDCSLIFQRNVGISSSKYLIPHYPVWAYGC